MTAGTYALVLLSAAAHAYWNFLLKRSGGSQSFVGLSKVAEAIFLLPVVILALVRYPDLVLSTWVFPVVGAVLVIANYVLLTAAYRLGDLSLIYPVARGAMLVFLPPLAYFAVAERLSPVGWAAIAVIIIGIFSLSWPWSRPAAGTVSAAALGLALLAALAGAGYTVWDKRAVQILSPLDYFAAYSVLVGIVYGIALRAVFPSGGLRAEWREHWKPILQVGVLNTGSYLLALVALQTGKASYVIALRQLSIAVGAVLGAKLLGEAMPAGRKVGIAMVVAGCVLLGMAR